MGDCVAKDPIWLGNLLIGLQTCGAPAVRAYIYECECGHIKVGASCKSHDPVGVEIGCALCLREKGHACSMTVTERG